MLPIHSAREGGFKVNTSLLLPPPDEELPDEDNEEGPFVGNRPPPLLL